MLLALSLVASTKNMHQNFALIHYPGVAVAVLGEKLRMIQLSRRTRFVPYSAFCLSA